MRILLLEDEESIRGFVRINLKRNGMDVVEAETGEAALDYARSEGPFDIALLDVMLPTISGFEVCAQLRELYPRMGIIMLTAKSQEEDKIYGLELGADDYVQKPFSPGELIARIKALYRRMKPALDAADESAGVSQAEAPDNVQHGQGKVDEKIGVQRGQRTVDEQTGVQYGQGKIDEHSSVSDVPGTVAEAEALKQLTGHSEQAAAANTASAYELQVAPFRLSITERKLWKDGKEIILTPTEWALVRLLMERVGESVSRDRILTEVWGRYYVGDLKVVDVNIRRIRQKIEKNPSDPAFIETVWGYGYRWKRGGNG